MDLVEEQDRALPAFAEPLAGALDRLADVLHAGGHRRQLLERPIGGPRDRERQRGLAGARRPPEQRRRQPIRLDEATQRPARTDEVRSGRRRRRSSAGAAEPPMAPGTASPSSAATANRSSAIRLRHRAALVGTTARRKSTTRSTSHSRFTHFHDGELDTVGLGLDVVADHTEGEPTLDLAHPTVLARAGRPFVGGPVRILTDQLDLLAAQPGLLAEFTPRGLLGRLSLVDATLRKLPRIRVRRCARTPSRGPWRS